MKIFYKLQASGNDFILIDHRPKTKNQRVNYKKLARKLCSRKLGIGADGLLVIESSKRADFKMRIFNCDGSEAEMCGNGIRCVGVWVSFLPKNPKTKKPKNLKIETKAGIVECEVRKIKEDNAEVKVKMSKPYDCKLNIPLKVLGRKIRVNYINSGVPHTVIFVQGLDNIDVEKIGQAVRFHKKFYPAGTNVNFVEKLKDNFINVRTYERGVERETLACGTGAVASAIITDYKISPALNSGERKYKVKTRGGEILKVYLNRKGNEVESVWLEGKAYLVYRGYIKI